MASKEHKELAQFLKEVHSSLRKATTKMGAKQAWQEHCENKQVLVKYAGCMEKLATTHWTENSNNYTCEASSRIDWTANLCYNYFLNIENFMLYKQKEIDIASKMNITITDKESFSHPIKLIDVGSCYNPFKKYNFLDVLAIDLCPANSSVLICDFLNVAIGSSTIISDKHKVEQIQTCFFDVVTFCFLLEYIPSSELRMIACQKAYRILKPAGLLIINTPDSKHVGANSKIMKCWQYTLANIGFTRIKYEKFRHMHCMAFRKALCKDTAVRWALLHKEPYMKNSIHIPQDFQKEIEEQTISKSEISIEDFTELPFADIIQEH